MHSRSVAFVVTLFTLILSCATLATPVNKRSNPNQQPPDKISGSVKALKIQDYSKPVSKVGFTASFEVMNKKETFVVWATNLRGKETQTTWYSKSSGKFQLVYKVEKPEDLQSDSLKIIWVLWPYAGGKFSAFRKSSQ